MLRTPHSVTIHLTQASSVINKDVGATLSAPTHQANWTHTAIRLTKEPFAKKSNNLVSFHFTTFFILLNDTLQIYLNWSQQMTCNARVPFILYWKSLAISFARLISSDKWFFVRQIFERVIHTWNHVGHRLCLNWAIIFIKISFIKVFALCPHPVWHAIAQQTQ